MTIILCPQEGHLDVELVTKLDELTFGDLFDTLFIDEQFNKDVKKTVNNRSNLFEKNDLIRELSEIEENSLWTKIFPNNEMNSLRESHRLLQGYRNDTMHAHRMTYGSYRDAKRLMQSINKELESSIEERLNGIQNIDHSLIMANLSKAIQEFSENLRRAYDFDPLLEVMKSAIKSYRFLVGENDGEGDPEE